MPGRCVRIYNHLEKVGPEGCDKDDRTVEEIFAYIALYKRLESDGIDKERAIAGLAAFNARPWIRLEDSDIKENAYQHIKNRLNRKTAQGGWYYDRISHSDVERILVELGAKSDGGSADGIGELDPNWMALCPEAVQQIKDHTNLIQQLEEKGIPRERIITALSESATRPIFALKDAVVKSKTIQSVEDLIRSGTDPESGKPKESLTTNDIQMLIQKVGLDGEIGRAHV